MKARTESRLSNQVENHPINSSGLNSKDKVWHSLPIDHGLFLQGIHSLDFMQGQLQEHTRWIQIPLAKLDLKEIDFKWLSCGATPGTPPTLWIQMCAFQILFILVCILSFRVRSCYKYSKYTACPLPYVFIFIISYISLLSEWCSKTQGSQY